MTRAFLLRLFGANYHGGAALLISLLIVAAPAWPQSGPQIPISVPLPFQVSTFGMVGVAVGQTARLSVVNSAPATGTCLLELAFVDAEGKVVKSTREQIDQGKSRSLDINRDWVQSPENRIQIRAVVNVVRGPLGADGTACIPISSVEVFDNETGKTTIILTQAQAVLSITP